MNRALGESLSIKKVYALNKCAGLSSNYLFATSNNDQ